MRAQCARTTNRERCVGRYAQIGSEWYTARIGIEGRARDSQGRADGLVAFQSHAEGGAPAGLFHRRDPEHHIGAGKAAKLHRSEGRTLTMRHASSRTAVRNIGASTTRTASRSRAAAGVCLSERPKEEFFVPFFGFGFLAAQSSDLESRGQPGPRGGRACAGRLAAGI